MHIYEKNHAAKELFRKIDRLQICSLFVFVKVTELQLHGKKIK